MDVIKAPMNYIGNKYRIISDIQKFFPRNIDTFVDIFCGGCDVTINTEAKRKFANDINYHVVEIYQHFQKMISDDIDIIAEIDKLIEKWELSKTNEEGYKAFREHYNQTKNPLELYTLMCFSFNYQFRFNNDHEYNNPFGKNRSSFTPVMRSNLIEFIKRIESVSFSSIDFLDFDYSVLQTANDFIYADPPYLLTCGSYNDGKRGFKGWNEDEEIKLLTLLAELDARGIKFALSNVAEHKGQKHKILLDWKKEHGFHIHNINFNYNNCNYQARNRENLTREVLITNY